MLNFKQYLKEISMGRSTHLLQRNPDHHEYSGSKFLTFKYNLSDKTWDDFFADEQKRLNSYLTGDEEFSSTHRKWIQLYRPVELNVRFRLTSPGHRTWLPSPRSYYAPQAEDENWAKLSCQYMVYDLGSGDGQYRDLGQLIDDREYKRSIPKIISAITNSVKQAVRRKNIQKIFLYDLFHSTTNEPPGPRGTPRERLGSHLAKLAKNIASGLGGWEIDINLNARPPDAFDDNMNPASFAIPPDAPVTDKISGSSFKVN